MCRVLVAGDLHGAEEAARGAARDALMSGGYRSFAHRVDIGAPVQRVWRAFTDSRLLERWATRGASITPREQGQMQITFAAGIEMDAHIDVLVTPQRLRLILLPTRGMPPADAASAETAIVEDFLFERLSRRPAACAVVERSALGAGLGDVLSAQAPALECAR